jgi:chemotaxis protein histidine kinase CheA
MSKQMNVTELLAKTLENMTKEFARECIRECANRNGLDGELEISALGLERVELKRKAMVRTSKPKAKVEKKVKTNKSMFPLPFMAQKVCPEGCQGLSYNRGLFTQCHGMRMNNGSYCKGCQLESDKNASGAPDSGTVAERLSMGEYEYQDSKGRKPTSYLKVLEKLKLSAETAKEEAGKLGLVIDEIHWQEAPKKKAAKGRPPKKVQVEVEKADLFAALTPDVVEEEVEEVDEVEEEKPKSKKLSEAEREAKKLALDTEREAKKLALEAEREAKKAALEADREAKKAALEADREAKKAALEADREAKKAAKKAELEAKKAELEAKKAELEAKKAELEAKKAAKKPEPKKKGAKKEEQEAAAAPAPAKVQVSRIMIEGVEYLKSAVNVLYNPETKEPMGIYDPVSKEMQELPDDDE